MSENTKIGRPQAGARRHARRVGAAAAAAAALLVAPSVRAANMALNTDAVGPTANFTDPIWTSGATVGTTGGTASVASGDALFFDTSGATSLNNDLTGATFTGFTFNPGASAYTFSGNAFTLAGNIVNNSTALQTFGNAISLGTSGRTFTTAQAGGGLTFNGGITQTGGGGTIFNSGVASTTAAGLSVITLGGTNSFASTTNNTGHNVSGSTNVTVTGTTSFSGNQVNSGGLGLTGNTLLTVSSGGTLNMNGSSNAGSTAESIIGQNTNNTTATLLADGGTINIGGGQGLFLGNNQDNQVGVLTIQNSGSVTINRGSTTVTDKRSFVAVGRDGANGVINLGSGTLATDRNFVRDGNSGLSGTSSAVFNFQGGTLKLLGDQADVINSATINTNQGEFTSVTATNTSTIDANGFNVGINNAITGTGGFTIDSSTGAGTVTFGGTGAKTYSGATNVVDSTLSLASTTALAGASGTGGVNVSGGTLTSTVADADLGGSLAVSGSGALSANGNAAVGSFDLASGKNFTLSAGTLFENLASTSSFDTITGSGGGTFSVTGGTLDLLNVVPDYTAGYAILSGFTGGSVSNLSITGYDSANYTASLDNTGVLTFVPVPEPTAAALLALAGAALLGRRARRARCR